MGRRFGEKKATPVPRIRRATRQEKELLKAGNGYDPRDYPQKQEPEEKKRAVSIDKLSDEQIEDAADRVIMGESLYKIADEHGVNADSLAKKIKTYVGMRYMREWQQSVKFDCLRAEMLLNRGLRDYMAKGNIASGKLVLEVLNYRARVLSFGAVNPQDQAIRVAGLSQEQLFNAILEQL